MCACCITLYMCIHYINFKKYIYRDNDYCISEFLCDFLVRWQMYMKAEAAQAYVKLLLNLEV